MTTVRILAADPSLRNTGLAILEYDTKLPLNEASSYSVRNCQVLVNPLKYKGVEAILNMIDMIHEESQREFYKSVDTVIVESPPVMFSKNFAAGIVSSLAHVSGAAVALLGLKKGFLYRPNEWNKSRKKEVTHAKTIEFLGDPENWHFFKKIKSAKHYEHVLDAVSMALWWIKNNYVED